MRDGRVGYDGPPLADDEVHHPSYGEPHTHHHHQPAGRPTTTPRTSTLPWTAGEPPRPAVTLDFMQRALLAALFTGLAAPAVGTYLVQRRLSLMGDGIGHVAVTGVALGLITGTSPTWTAVASRPWVRSSSS